METYSRRFFEIIPDPPGLDSASQGTLAIFIYARPNEVPLQIQYINGVHFWTDPLLPLQVATIHHVKGTVIPPHNHIDEIRRIVHTVEVLTVQTGKLKVDIYTCLKELVVSRVLGMHDVVILLNGGHGFEMVETGTILEVKQGPYMGDRDKLRWKGDRNEPDSRIRDGLGDTTPGH